MAGITRGEPLRALPEDVIWKEENFHRLDVFRPLTGKITSDFYEKNRSRICSVRPLVKLLIVKIPAGKNNMADYVVVIHSVHV